jgi:hypothetical protein
MFVETEKLDQLAFMGQVWHGILDDGGRASDDYADYHNCNLGKWYYEGEGRRAFSNLPGFKELEPQHKELHHQAVEAIRHARAGDMQQVLAAVGRMQEASQAIFVSLDRMLQRDEEDEITLF